MSDTPIPPPTPPPTRPIGGPGAVPCASCGYDLRGVAIGSVCPECGSPVNQIGPPVYSGVPPQTSGKAIASMVLGIVSIVTCMFYGLPGIVCGTIAVVLARKAEVAIQVGEAPVTSRGMAKAGRVCGWVGISLGIVYLLLVVAYFVLFFGILAAAASGGGGSSPFGP